MYSTMNSEYVYIYVIIYINYYEYIAHDSDCKANHQTCSKSPGFIPMEVTAPGDQKVQC